MLTELYFPLSLIRISETRIRDNDGKRVWKGIKQIIHFKPKTDQSVTELIDNGREITETDNIANTFNEYFSKLANDLAAQIPEVQTSPFSYLSNHSFYSFFISSVTAGEIEMG